jgi:hypothetical protein
MIKTRLDASGCNSPYQRTCNRVLPACNPCLFLRPQCSLVQMFPSPPLLSLKLLFYPSFYCRKILCDDGFVIQRFYTLSANCNFPFRLRLLCCASCVSLVFQPNSSLPRLKVGSSKPLVNYQNTKLLQ